MPHTRHGDRGRHGTRLPQGAQALEGGTSTRSLWARSPAPPTAQTRTPPPARSCLCWNVPLPPVRGQVRLFPDLSPCRHPSFLPRVCLNSCSCRRLRRHRLLSLGARITLGCHCLWNVPFFPRRLSAPKGWLSPAVLMPPQPHIPFHSTGPGIYNQFHSFIQQLFAESCFATPWPSQ